MQANPPIKIKATGIKVELIQTRAEMSEEHIAHLTELIKQKKDLPPIRIFADGQGSEWLTDGTHRLEAALRAKAAILVQYFQGSYEDALVDACGANQEHGLRRTNADKRYAVELALEAFGDQSDRALADMCGVCNAFVGSVRSDRLLTVNSQILPDSTKQGETRIGRDGRTYNVANLSKPAAPIASTEDGAKPAVKPRSAKKNGSPTVSIKQRKDLQLHLGKLIRGFSDVGLFEANKACFDQLAVALKKLQ
ncbi:ParB N-terminal domain-containing protein [Bythopirellula goksoeyrii]|uniref:ParB N-terminal domain-containing protein n=1 Tax=Bythopirellula goksoeyrii TaxID=1400387 RepID=UPI00143D786E|nr:ParB N-terminal domain-containing protein [Bythopirellula goksoeyrii]